MALVLESQPDHPPHLPREGRETQRGEEIWSRSGWEHSSWPGVPTFPSTPSCLPLAAPYSFLGLATLRT